MKTALIWIAVLVLIVLGFRNVENWGTIMFRTMAVNCLGLLFAAAVISTAGWWVKRNRRDQ